MRKRQGNLKGSIRTLRNGVWYTDKELAKVAMRKIAVESGEGYNEGRLVGYSVPPVTVSESAVAERRAKREADEARRLAAKLADDKRKYVVVPSTTELELAMAAAAREAREMARRSAKRAEFAHRVNVARIKRAMSGAL